MKQQEEAFLIQDVRGKRYRTLFGWVDGLNDFIEGEKLKHFPTRKEADQWIKETGTVFAQSWRISSRDPLWKFLA